MTLRVASRLVLLLAVLALATAMIVGAMALLVGADGPALVELDQVAAVERATEAPAKARQAADGTPTVVFVFAGMVLLAAVPPVYQVYAYRRSSYGGWH